MRTDNVKVFRKEAEDNGAKGEDPGGKNYAMRDSTLVRRDLMPFMSGMSALHLER